MLKTNYHTHCFYCDGKGTPEEYVLEASRRGLTAIGFSSHAPVPFPTEWNLKEKSMPLYMRDVREAGKKAPEGLQVYLGLEADYIRDTWGPDTFADRGLDYIIGAVHMIKHPVDGRYLDVDGLDEDFEELFSGGFGKDIKALVREYYTLLCELMERHRFDFLAHFDLVKKKNHENRYFDEHENWYRSLALEAMKLAAEKGIPVEINSGGISRGAIDTVYPSPWLIREAKDLSVPILISADAHQPEHLDFHFEESLEICRRAGYREVRVLVDGRWREEGL